MFVGFDAYKKAIAAGVDMVLLATPPGFRPIHYAAAVEAGKHVFMEKPCCIDAPGFRSLLETNKLADEKGLKVAVGLQRRHSKHYRGKVAEIRDGSLGDLTLLRAYWNSDPIWIRKRKSAAGRKWNTRCATGTISSGSAATTSVEQHVHNLDVCNWVKGDHPVRGQRHGRLPLPRQPRHRPNLRPSLRRVHLPTTARSSTASAASSRTRGTASRSSSTESKA